MTGHAAQACAPTATDYLSRLSASWARAAEQSGETVVDLALGPVSVELRIAGTALPPVLLPPLERLRSRGGTAAPATIYAFDGASTGASPPPFRTRIASTQANARFRSAHHTYPGDTNGSFETLAVYDTRDRVGVFWARERLHWYERADPLRALLHWTLGSEGIWLVHASAVGDHRGAIVMTGRGGSGKTTTALASVDAGMSLVGDDQVAVAVKDDSPVVYGVYGDAKIRPATLTQLPDLRAALLAPGAPAQEKLVVDLCRARQGRMIAQLPIKAVAVPEVVGLGETRVRPLSRPETLLALAPTTVFGTPRDGSSMAAMGELVRRVPCYKLDLGGDVADGPRELSRLLDQLRA